MMYSQRGAAQYHAVRSHGLVADASPARLVQIMFEHILSHLAIAQGCMERIRDNLPLRRCRRQRQGHGQGDPADQSAQRHPRHGAGGQIAENLRALYVYMLARLTTANLHNDAQIVAEVSNLVRKIKTGWDQIVKDGR